MGTKLGIPLVATNDCHYVNRTDAAAHDVLMAIQTGKSLKDEKRLKHQVDSYYMKSPAEMDAALQGRAPRRSRTPRRSPRSATSSSSSIRRTCRRYKVPEGETLDTYIAKIVEQGPRAPVPRA